MPGERPSDEDPVTSRTDLPPRREPHTGDDFGAGEEEDGGRGRSAAEDAAGGDREIG